MDLSEKEWADIVARLDHPEDDHRDFEVWLSKSAENRALYERLHQIWDQSKDIAYLNRTQLIDDWNTIHGHLRPQRKPMMSWVAAAVSVLIISGFLLYNLLTPSMSWKTYTTGDTPREIRLSDGSIVNLNSGATLRVNQDFERGRNLILEGSAFFEVTPDPEKPFSVKSGLLTTKVLGTSFHLDVSNDEVVLQVSEGKVSFSSNQQEKLLTAGEAAIWRDGVGINIKPYDINSISWKTGMLRFDDAPLDIVIDDLSSHFGVTIKTEAFKHGYPLFTSRFDEPVLSEVLDEMALVLDLEIAMENGSYILRPSGK